MMNRTIDEMTGCHHGWYCLPYLTELFQSEPRVMLFANTDKTKTIGNYYGHLEGDNAIVVTASALLSCGEPCIRISDDEFLLLSNQNLQILIKQIHDFLDRYHIQSGKPYQVSVSLGYKRIQPGENLLTCIQEAYEHMGMNKINPEKHIKKFYFSQNGIRSE